MSAKRGFPLRWKIAGGAAAVIVVVGGVFAGVWRHVHTSAESVAGPYQSLMGLTALDHPVKPAPDFTLTDQNGKKVSLSSLRGKVVVLDFMDPVCTDICPIVSAELVQANHLLGSDSKNVEFLAVNVNQYHESQAAVMKFSQEHGLSKLPNWHFLTGSTAELKTVWKAYGISVVPNPTGDVEHSSFMFFIDKQGNEAYVANPDNTKSAIGQWAHGIQQVSAHLT